MKFLSCNSLVFISLLTSRSVVAENSTNASDDDERVAVVCGGGTAHACDDAETTALKTDSYPFRCCADHHFFNSQKKDSCNVYGASRVFTGCPKPKTYQAAVSSCASVGARICSKEEILANCVAGTGCNFDNSLVWSIVPRELDQFKPLSMYVGGHHVCAFDRPGNVYCWGNNRHGQLGNGETSEYATIVPTQISGDIKGFTASLGLNYSCIVDKVRNVWCWGSNSSGQLGFGDTLDRSTPSQLNLEDAERMELGDTHACIIDKKHKVWCWGSNTYGQIGNGETSTQPTLPTDINFEARTLSVGGDHSCAIDMAEDLWCWGRNTDGQLGTGNNLQLTTPTNVRFKHKVKAVAAGTGHTCAVTSVEEDEEEMHMHMHKQNATLSCWGRNDFGQLGVGNNEYKNQPTGVSVIETDYFYLYGVGHNTCFQSEGSLWCWGSGANGRLGTGDSSDRLTPSNVTPKNGVSRVMMGHAQTCIYSQIDVMCWGSNESGQLGLGGGSFRETPTIIDFLPSDEEIEEMGSYLSEIIIPVVDVDAAEIPPQDPVSSSQSQSDEL